ncbi:hypothetical protein KP509_15G067200 [Ceratopteris richardii]|uniref:PROP1-like PPR domain-containing protein n=1 Tax=Ceratopteris richardii TaxID=49495 RepID=A0A8T2TAR4_CERRI|nr:hypothetical protein KP509_15G067200 [Ceratopteris richardii]
MASLSIFPAASPESLQLLRHQEQKQQVQALATAYVHNLGNFENSPSPCTSSQQQKLLRQLALQVEHKKPNDKPTDPIGRAIAHCVRNVRQVNDVDAYLHGLHFDPHAFTTAIQKLGHWRLVDQAFYLFQWLGSQSNPEQQPNMFIFCSILSVMKARQDFMHFDYVLADMKRRRINPNLVLYNIMIECYMQQGRHTDVISCIVELAERGFVPERPIFKALFCVAENKANVNQVLTIFASTRNVLSKYDMKGPLQELHDFVSALYSRIIYAALQKKKGPDYIRRLFQLLDENMMDLSVPHYDEILQNCCLILKDCVVTKYILKRRWKISPPLGVELCNHIMQVMEKDKKWWAALEVFEHMRQEGPPPNAESYVIVRSLFNSLLNVSKERGTCHWSVQLLEKMEEHNIKPDQQAWDTTLIACALKVDADLAIHVFEKMIEKGHQPNVLSYGALLSTLEKCGLYDGAEQVWNHMERMRVKPNIRVYTIMISVYGASQKYEDLRRLLDKMYASNVRPTLVTYNALITVCAMASNGQGALEWMRKLIESGFEPDVTSYSQLILALSSGGQAELAKNMYIEAKELGLLVYPVALDSLVNVCSTHNIELPHELNFRLEASSIHETESKKNDVAHLFASKHSFQ